MVSDLREKAYGMTAGADLVLDAQPLRFPAPRQRLPDASRVGLTGKVCVGSEMLEGTVRWCIGRSQRVRHGGPRKSGGFFRMARCAHLPA